MIVDIKMKFNVGEYKFTFIRYSQMIVALAGIIFLYLSNYHLMIIVLLVMSAGMCNGNADAINFSYNQVVWRRWLKGKLLKWFEDEYGDDLQKKWFVHAIFYDGWHFFKNMWVLFLLVATGYSLYQAVFNCSFFLGWFDFGIGVIVGLVLYMIFVAYCWMVGKEMWHHHLARASFWGYSKSNKFFGARHVIVDGCEADELSPNIMKYLRSKIYDTG